MGHKISKIIHDVCKNYEINFTSIRDAKRLGKIILEINQLTDEIYQILDRHDIKSTLKDDIENSLLKLHALDHELIMLSKQLKKQNEN